MTCVFKEYECKITMVQESNEYKEGGRGGFRVNRSNILANMAFLFG